MTINLSATKYLAIVLIFMTACAKPDDDNRTTPYGVWHVEEVAHFPNQVNKLGISGIEAKKISPTK